MFPSGETHLIPTHHRPTVREPLFTRDPPRRELITPLLIPLHHVKNSSPRVGRASFASRACIIL